jgi:corrinoid protein of di/trimethylamine methyltransferase
LRRNERRYTAIGGWLSEVGAGCKEHPSCAEAAVPVREFKEGPMQKDELLKEVREALVKLDEARLEKAVGDAMDSGLNPVVMIEEGLGAGLRTLGDKFQQGEVFIPHLAMAADMARREMDRAKASMASGGELGGGPVAVIGTVRDDIHDLGKNLVGALLSVSGFRVVDLGKDVSPERFVQEVRSVRATLVGMSALMTTTMVNQRSVIEALKKEGLRDGVGVMVGGAPTSTSWADEIGADGHADDAVTAVRLASALASKIQSGGGKAK